jgi:nucleotide-binding universal stress UspA family protein
VPVGGRGDHELRARMLGAIAGAGARTFTFLSVLGEGASDRDLAERRDEIATLADLRIPGEIEVEVSRAKDPPAAIIGRAANSDLVVLGLKEVGWGRRVFGDVALRIASESPCAAIMLSYRRSRAYSELYRPLREAIPLGRPRGRRDRS